MQGQRKCPGKDLLNHARLFQIIIVDERIIHPLGELELRRENEIGHKELHSSTNFNRKIVGADFN
jgi:hypothetical protein